MIHIRMMVQNFITELMANESTISVGRGFRRFWYDLHVAGGMYALFFLLAMALTGLTWSFGLVSLIRQIPVFETEKLVF